MKRVKVSAWGKNTPCIENCILMYATNNVETVRAIIETPLPWESASGLDDIATAFCDRINQCGGTAELVDV
jgi:hypothetical protein